MNVLLTRTQFERAMKKGNNAYRLRGNWVLRALDLATGSNDFTMSSGTLALRELDDSRSLIGDFDDA